MFLDEKNMYFFLKSAEIRKKVQKIRQYNKKKIAIEKLLSKTDT